MHALAHPTRLALLDPLHAVEQATATECAEFVDESPSSCSYHLRALAKWGFVEEAEQRPGRERPWRAAAARIEFPSGRPALRHEHELPGAWRRAVQTSAATLKLTTGELEELGERFEALLDGFRGR